MTHTWKDDCLIINLRVVPNAKVDAFVGCYNEQYKIKLKAPAVDNKANDHLILVLSKWFDVPKTAVHLIKGQHSRDKKVQIKNPQKQPKWLTHDDSL